MGLCQWERAVPSLSLHRAGNTNPVCPVEMLSPALGTHRDCPLGLGAMLEGHGLLGIAGGCLHVVQAQVGLSLCNHQCWWVLGTCGSSPAACISVPSSPTEMGTSMATT